MPEITVRTGTDSHYPSCRVRIGPEPIEGQDDGRQEIALVFRDSESAMTMHEAINRAVKAYESRRVLRDKAYLSLPNTVLGRRLVR